MRTAQFDLLTPGSVNEAIALLTKYDDVKVLAGGQSLVPLMKFRLVRPRYLLDLHKIPSLAYIKQDQKRFYIGCMTTHDAIASSNAIRLECPLLAATAEEIADPQIRNRGTIGGSLCHADPNADYLPTIVALGSEMKISGSSGERTVRAEDFFLDTFLTLLQPTELVTEIQVPILPATTGSAFIKISRMEHDFGVVNVATLLSLTSGEKCADATIILGGVASKPVRAEMAEDTMKGKKVNEDLIKEAAELAKKAPMNPQSDVRGTAEYKIDMVSVGVKRALLRPSKQQRGH